MNDAAVLEIGREAVVVVLQIAGPVMAAGMAVGIVVALVQALTTIQEMTLTFVPKIIVMLFASILFLPFMMATLIEFTRSLFDRMIGLE
jgi:flagellar biosynthetic protein FliQ